MENLFTLLYCVLASDLEFWSMLSSLSQFMYGLYANIVYVNSFIKNVSICLSWLKIVFSFSVFFLGAFFLCYANYT